NSRAMRTIGRRSPLDPSPENRIRVIVLAGPGEAGRAGPDDQSPAPGVGAHSDELDDMWPKPRNMEFPTIQSTTPRRGLTSTRGGLDLGEAAGGPTPRPLPGAPERAPELEHEISLWILRRQRPGADWRVFPRRRAPPRAEQLVEERRDVAVVARVLDAEGVVHHVMVGERDDPVQPAAVDVGTGVVEEADHGCKESGHVDRHRRRTDEPEQHVTDDGEHHH